MSSIKKSVLLSKQTHSYLAARTRLGEDIAWSQNINEGFRALSWITQQSLPVLTPAEWEILLNVYAGSWIEFQPPFRIASDIMDNFGALELSQLDPEVADLSKKMHALSQVEQYSVMEFIRIFWLHDWNSEPDFETIQAKISKML